VASSLTPTGIAFDRSGPPGGTAVVLIHAAVADRRMWDPQWAGLTAKRDAVRLDLHGFGESDVAPVGALDPVGDVLDTLDSLVAWWTMRSIIAAATAWSPKTAPQPLKGRLDALALGLEQCDLRRSPNER
jgi:pimeloyl-ACP methyl ester carboxylesterase